MNVLILFTYGVSLQVWDKIGILQREISVYNALKEKNVNFKFLTYGTDKDFKYSQLLKNINVIPTYKFIKSKIPKIHFIKSLFLPFKLKKVFLETDLIKTNQIQGSWVAYIAKIFFKKKIIVRGGFERLYRHIVLSKRKGLIDYLKYLINYYWISINELIAFKLADGIILTSEYDISFIVEHFKLKKKYKSNRIRHLYNFVDVDLFKPLSLPKKPKKILFIGRLKTQKNLINLIKAFKDLEGFALDIIGRGPIKNQMKKVATNLGIQINFLGVIPNEKIPEIMNEYEIIILPSYWEGNPKVLLEAMSCGLACIGTNIPGIYNIIKHEENGYLCELSPDSIKNAILTLHKDIALRKKLGTNARKFILENCSLKVIVEKEYQFYKEILEKKI